MNDTNQINNETIRKSKILLVDDEPGLRTAVKTFLEDEGFEIFIAVDGDDGWEKAIDGCDYVLHIASPFINGLPDHEDELIKPALTGTQRILKLSATNPQIKKIIITSSFAAVGDTFNGQTVFNESDWSDPNNNKISAYNKSKTLAVCHLI